MSLQRTLPTALVTMLGALSADAMPSSSGPSIPVAAGRHTIVHVNPGTTSAQTADQGVATAQLLSDTEVLVSGVTHGSTRLTVQGRHGSETFNVLIDTAAPVEANASSEDETFSVGFGKQKTLSAPGVKRVAIGDPAIAQVTVLDGRELLVTGVAKGSTSLIVWGAGKTRTTYLVKVVDRTPDDYAAEIKDLLGPVPGVRVRVMGERVLIEGEVASAADRIQVRKICEMYPEVALCP
jgi:Flp pilus assembly secretin CpaC